MNRMPEIQISSAKSDLSIAVLSITVLASQ